MFLNLLGAACQLEGQSLPQLSPAPRQYLDEKHQGQNKKSYLYNANYSKYLTLKSSNIPVDF